MGGAGAWASMGACYGAAAAQANAGSGPAVAQPWALGLDRSSAPPLACRPRRCRTCKGAWIHHLPFRSHHPLLLTPAVLYFSMLFAVLFGFWLLLSGFWDNGLLLGLGLASSAFVAWIGVRLERPEQDRYGPGMLLRLPRYLAWLVVAIVQSNIDVVRRVWYPEVHPISPMTGRLPVSQRTRLGKTIYANSITLTPGTVAIEVSDDDVLVHALTREAFDDLAGGEMDRRVAGVEGRAGGRAGKRDAERRD